jgi:hypothetical protein
LNVVEKQYRFQNECVVEKQRMELFSMRTIHLFLIDSDHSGHRLAVDGNRIGTLPTLRAAEATANHIARSFVPAATLTFELDFKWTLSDSEIRAAILECPSRRGDGETVCG